MDKLTHFSDAGRARMVDVSEKSGTHRVAVASGILRMQHETLARIRNGSIAKGDVLTVADVGAVMAAKRTADIIPMCHTLALSRRGGDVQRHRGTRRSGSAWDQGGHYGQLRRRRPGSRWKRCAPPAWRC